MDFAAATDVSSSRRTSWEAWRSQGSSFVQSCRLNHRTPPRRYRLTSISGQAKRSRNPRKRRLRFAAASALANSTSGQSRQIRPPVQSNRQIDVDDPFLVVQVVPKRTTFPTRYSQDLSRLTIPTRIRNSFNFRSASVREIGGAAVVLASALPVIVLRQAPRRCCGTTST